MGGNVSVRLGHEEAGSNSGYVGGGDKLGTIELSDDISRKFSQYLE